jgi:hypothetical protein
MEYEKNLITIGFASFGKRPMSKCKCRLSASPAEIAFAEIPIPAATSSVIPDAVHTPAAMIKYNSVSIEISNDISEVMLSRVLREVAHA